MFQQSGSQSNLTSREGTSNQAAAELILFRRHGQSPQEVVFQKTLQDMSILLKNHRVDGRTVFISYAWEDESTEEGKPMQELGKKTEIFGSELLRPLTGFDAIHSRPDRMPTLRGKDKVICGYDQGLGERMFVCDTLEDMQALYDAYASGGALRIHWYLGEDPGFVYVLGNKQSRG